MLQYPDVARSLADDRGDGPHVEIPDHAEENDLRLLGRKRRGDQVDGPLRTERRQRLLLDVASRSGLDQSGGFARLRPPPGPSAAEIADASSGDRERERSEGVLIAPEAPETPDDLEPDITGDILRLGRLDDPQIANHARVQGSIQLGQRPPLSVASRDEHRFEPLSRIHEVSRLAAPIRAGARSVPRILGSLGP
jgi:hypothetical protein